MKRLTFSVLFLLLTTLLFFNVEVKAQAFVPVGTKWYYGVINSGTEPAYTYPFNYECITLETKDSKTYSVIKCSELWSSNTDSLFYLRSDSGKVYQWVLEDQLVFDFNMNIGDTFLLSPNIWGMNPYKCKVSNKYYTKNYRSTDSLLCFDIFTTTNSHNFPHVSHVCEKILKLSGNSNHNFTDFNDAPEIMEESFGIRCFDIPTITDSFHLSKPGTLCDYKGDWYPGAGSSVKEIAGVQSLHVFPNPVTDVLNISSEKIISNIDFCNATGIKIVSVEAHDNSISINPHLYGLENGLYILAITSGEEVFHYKILIK